MYQLQLATQDDVQKIQDILYPGYFNETIYSGLEYDPVSTRGYIREWIDGGYCFYATCNGEVVGVLSFFIHQTYYKQNECEVIMFYVKPEHRGTGLSRTMVKLIDKLCKESGKVHVIYVSSASGKGGNNDALFTNLFKKFGFKVLGTELIKVIGDE